MIFTFRVFVDDRKLGRALAALDGLAEQVETPQPVRNAVRTKNGLASTAKGSILDIELPPGNSKFKAGQLRPILAGAGFTSSSLSYAINRLVDAKRIKKTNERGVYTVTGGNPK